MPRSIPVAAILLAVAIAPTSALADDYETINQYSVEFACGTNSGDSPGVVAGDYATIVNVHNANPAATSARSMVSLTVPGMSQSDPLVTEFDPQQSRKLDCENIRNQFVFIQPIGSEPLLEGFLLIQSRLPLEVVARYTATGDDAEVSVDVERIVGSLIQREIDDDDDGTVTICHLPPGNPDNAQEIEVGADAVPAHLEHGDYEGECDDVVIQPVVSSTVSNDDDDEDEDDDEDGNNGNRWGSWRRR